jgi:hypothetical protein
MENYGTKNVILKKSKWFIYVRFISDYFTCKFDAMQNCSTSYFFLIFIHNSIQLDAVKLNIDYIKKKLFFVLRNSKNRLQFLNRICCGFQRFFLDLRDKLTIRVRLLMIQLLFVCSRGVKSCRQFLFSPTFISSIGEPVCQKRWVVLSANYSTWYFY